MSERNDDGTFAAATTELPTGQAGVEASQGFRPMERPKDDDDLPSSIEAEAARITLSREFSEEAAPEDVELGYLTPTGEKVDPAETLPLARAAKDLSSYHAALDDNRAQSVSAEFAEAVDRMRAEAIKANPELAEHYGLDAADTLEKAAAADKTEATDPHGSVDDGPTVDGLDPEVTRALKLPQVRQAIEQELTQASAAREQYSQGLATANQFARAAFLETVPELAGLPEAQIEAGLHLLSQQNPARFNHAMATLTRVAQIQAEQQRMQQQQAAIQNAQFETTVAAEDEKLVRMFGGDKTQADAANNAAISYLRENGVPREQLLNVFKENPVLRTAEARRTIWEAEQYRKMKSTPLPKAAPKALPPVQKPGARSGPATRSDNSSTIASLQRELASASGQKAIRIAARLQAAKRS